MKTESRDSLNLKGEVKSVKQYFQNSDKKYLESESFFDEYGYQVRMNLYDSNGLEAIFVKKFDKNRNLTEDYSIGWVEHYENLRETYKYDERGNEIEICAYSSQSNVNDKIIWKLNEKHILEYDDNNNVIEESFYSKRTLESKNKYEYTKYDEYLNWVERIKNDTEIETREIEYYD